MKEHAKDPRLAYVQLFHNHGKDAGASIIHPHYQVMSTPFVPPHIHREVQGCEQYMEKYGSDVYGDIVKRETADGRRLVHDGDRFAVISAYASRQPFETWVLPKKASARFEEASPEDLTHLAAALKSTLSKLYTKLNDPPLNFYIHTLPLPGSGRNVYDERAYRWHLTIFPRISVWAGFEYGTGIPVNPVPPEQSAHFLKS
jgi:UDPglucose--hexose-1-phosphate uridylyltransferase